MDLQNNLVMTSQSLKRKRFVDDLAALRDLVMESEVVEESTRSASVTHQPQTSSSYGGKKHLGVKQAKEDLRNGKTHEQVACAQAQASLEMARAIRMKAPILHDMTTQQLFGINIAEISNPMRFGFMY